MQDFDYIKDNLLKKEQDLKDRVERLGREEDMLLGDLLQNTESATFAWYADVELTKSVLRNESLHMLNQVQQSLKKLEKGIYGQCEKCGERIGAGRLSVMPTAVLCSACL